MAPDVGVASKSSAGKNGGTSRHILKKGPWTAAEDAILMEYVKKHGEGNWNAVQRNSGLMRCGKSCRLRWANHLRPHLKKGAFSSEEEALIVELHAKLGNKWARMAAQLPGRTDNEIKNYWNTRLKRRQRAGLPIYPHDVNLKIQSHHQQPENSQGNPSSSISSLLSPPPPPSSLSSGYSTPLSIFDIFHPSNIKHQVQQPTPLYHLSNPNEQFKFFQENNPSALALSLSSASSPFSSSSGTLPMNNQGLPSSLSMPSIQYNCLNFRSDSTPVSGVSFEQNGVVSGAAGGIELPSIQSLVPTTTPTSSMNNASTDYVIATSSDADEHETRGNSGLLEDLIDESQALTRSEKSKEIVVSEEDKSQENYLWDYKVTEGLNFSQDQDEQINIESSPAHSSIRANTRNASSEETNDPVDDDFLSLLENFPMTVPMPVWSCTDGNGNITNGQSSNSGGGEMGTENQQESSDSLAGTLPTQTDGNFDIGSCCWKNMPGIYQM